MKTVELNRGWHHISENGDDYVSLPYESQCYGKISLDMIPEIGAAHAFADIAGAEGVIDVFVDGECAGTLPGGVRELCDLGALKGGRTSLRLEMEDGGAVRGGVTVHYTHADTYIRPHGLFVRTDSIADGKALLTVTADVTGTETEKTKLVLELVIYNARGRRSCRKTKTFVYAGGDKTVTVPVKMRSAYAYESDKPYLYKISAVLRTQDGDVLDESETSFGVRVQGAFEPGGMIGATVPHGSAILGGSSYPDAERRKLSALRDLGYNTVRYVGCPSEAALAAADELGLKVIVDIFDNWTYPREGSLSHISFASCCARRAAYAVSVVRNHPSVVMYSAGNKCEESYGRRGAELAEEIFAAVRLADPSRPVGWAIGKLVPTAGELTAHGVGLAEIAKAGDAELIAMGDRLGLPEEAAEGVARIADVLLCSGGISAPEGVPYMRIDTRPEDAFDAMRTSEDDMSMLGELSLSGTDRAFHGVTVAGDIDHTSLPRNAGLYRSMLAGVSGSFMLVGASGAGLFEGRQCWKGSDGEKLSVRVFTPGDVVALYLNGYLVGRRLAGRINKQYATFEVEYAGGTLEAVSYLRGRECDRVRLVTPGEPKGISLLTGSRRLNAGQGQIGFIDLWVTDERGDLCADYSGDIEISAEGEGEIVAMGNEYGRDADENVVGAVGGHALIAVRGLAAGKFTVKAKARGLRGGRVTFTVKE